MSIQSKGSDSLRSAGSSPGFFVRWSSTSTILTLMAWRSNILQKSFERDCSSLLKNDLRFTRRWQSLQLAVTCCAFCTLFMCYQKCLNFAVLKVRPSGIVIVLDLAVWGDVSVFCSWGDILRRIWSGSSGFGRCCQPFVTEAASWILMWNMVFRWWTCSGSNRLWAICVAALLLMLSDVLVNLLGSLSDVLWLIRATRLHRVLLRWH